MEAAQGTRQVQAGAAGTPGAVTEEAAQDLDLWTAGRGPGGRGGGRAAGAAAGAAPRQCSLLSLQPTAPHSPAAFLKRVLSFRP